MKPLLDKRRLADLLGVSVSWVEKATAARAIPITWVGRYARYDQDDIAAWLDSRKEPADRPATVGSGQAEAAGGSPSRRHRRLRR